ncbi:GNAT family N-acetyltransferase [Kosakonia oryzendophytica]|uniref:GNAT family N-acetyltransferase n=1 Tax=Kosakonia oryzendophytica TaxID=1005665 RepID=UPI000776F50E|nr:GNAT family N-acetyltransferase [Kosakonia oryzendophytica]WBT56776.1 GNAT family N-acetyltransferase [Kosakonia oryzendophytica]
MKIRYAEPDEAEQCWYVRNQSIRYGCANSYAPDVIKAWTPDTLPEHFLRIMADNPFFVASTSDGVIVATGFLDLSSESVEAIFTLPEYTGNGLAGLIIDAIKNEARQRGIKQLVLSSTPNARTFYEKHGFTFVRENTHYSGLAKAKLRCIDMTYPLQAV